MSRQLLGPGFLGLMVVGVLAANMSTIAAQSMAASALFVRNIYQPFRPNGSDSEFVLAGRLTIIVALGLGIVAALLMDDIFQMLMFMLTVNVPFGATIMLMFFWRRLSTRAVWISVIACVMINTVAPVALPYFESVRTQSSLLTRTQDETGVYHPIYFESVVQQNPGDESSPLIGRARLRRRGALNPAARPLAQ